MQIILPYEVIRYIIQYIDNIETRIHFGVTLPLSIQRYNHLIRLFQQKPVLMQEGYMRHFIPNKFNSIERQQQRIDDDSMEIGIQMMDDCVYYIYNLYIFKKSDDPVTVQQGVVDINLEVYCWHYKEYECWRY
jgi:hypothetical protein